MRVVETRPLSATKRWRLLEVLERASRDPEACMRMRRFGYHGDTLEILKAKQAELERKLAENDESRARVWRHEETGRIAAGDVAERLSLLGDARKKLERRFVALMSERRMLECAAEEDANAERLFRTAHDQYQAGDVETKRESAPKAIARRSPVAIALGLLIVALLGYATYRIMWPQDQGRRPPGRGQFGGAQPVGVATVARGWERELAASGTTAVLASNDSALATLLGLSTGWRDVARDDRATLFEKGGRP